MDRSQAEGNGWTFIGRNYRDRKQSLYVKQFGHGKHGAIVALPGLQDVAGSEIHEEKHTHELIRELKRAAKGPGLLLILHTTDGENSDFEFVVRPGAARKYLNWLKRLALGHVAGMAEEPP